MLVIKTYDLDENNSRYLNAAGELAVVEGTAAVLILCKTAAQTLENELLYEKDVGIPYFETVWRGEPNIRQYEAALYKALISVEGVVGVYLSINTAKSTLKYNATIATVYGDGEMTIG